MKPILITMGDPNGVGPEICLQAYAQLQVEQTAPFIVLGDVKVLKECALKLYPQMKVVEIHSLDIPSLGSNELPVFEAGFRMESEVNPGKVCPAAGRASIGWVKAAVEFILDGKAAAMVTAPICKESIEKDIPGFQGHTEFIGEMCGDPEPVLSLIHGNWVVAHVSTHVSLRDACDRVQIPRIKKTARLLHQLCSKLSPDKEIVLGMAGLNPHAGENGLFGKEEIEVINPAAKELRAEGIQISDALPGDVVFPQMKAGKFDGVVAMYHDQGHVVTKTIAFDLGKERALRGVNMTLGVELIRTSVDHGTGFDLAWQGKTSAASLIDAMEIARKMVLE